MTDPDACAWCGGRAHDTRRGFGGKLVCGRCWTEHWVPLLGDVADELDRGIWLLARLVDDWCNDQFCYGRPLERDGKSINHTKLNEMWGAAKALIPPDAQRERTQRRLEEATARLREMNA